MNENIGHSSKLCFRMFCLILKLNLIDPNGWVGASTVGQFDSFMTRRKSWFFLCVAIFFPAVVMGCPGVALNDLVVANVRA